MQPHRQTVADIRAVSGAIISWITDQFSLPADRATVGTGLAVAIPAVVGYNVLQRSVKNTAWRATALGHALVGHLRSTGK